jgi:hypothetical protein
MLIKGLSWLNEMGFLVSNIRSKAYTYDSSQIATIDWYLD